MGPRVKIYVDPDVCVGNAVCRSTAEGVFVATTHDVSEVGDPDAQPLEKILEAAADCPVAAISVTDAETGEELA